MNGLIEHLIIGPIVLPLVVAAGMLLIDERRRIVKGVLSIATMTATMIIIMT